MNEDNKVAPSPNPAPVKNTPLQMPSGAPQSTAQNTITDILQKQSGNQTPPPVTKLDPNLVQKPIRTFESDLAEALAKKQGSVASISIAESKKKEEESRKMENAAKAQQTTPQAAAQQAPTKPFQRPISPTRETAIPGAAIYIPPEAQRDEGRSEIVETIRSAVPQPETPPIKEIEPIQTVDVPLAQKPPETPAAEPVQTPAPAPKLKFIKTDTPKVSAMNVPVPIESLPKKSILKPFLLAVSSFILIGAGAYAGYYVYLKSKNSPPPASQPIVISSVFPQDKFASVTVASEAGDNLISKIYSEIGKNNIENGEIMEVRLYEAAPESQIMTASSFIGKLNTGMPNIISRSLTDKWMLGVYGEETGQKTTFIAFTTDFFQNAFAGMLSWEDGSMADDLALLLNFKDRARRDDLGATTTISSYFSIPGNFYDKVIKNRDVREFRNPSGELLFLYSFINKETMVITTTESAFIALVERVEKDSYVR